MATRKRHSKTQFVIPEEVQGAAEAGWIYKTEPEPVLVREPGAPRRTISTDDLLPIDSGIRAISHSISAIRETFLFTTQMMTLPMTLAVRVLRR